MKNQKNKRKSNSTPLSRRFSLITVTVAAVIVAAAGSIVVSKQLTNSTTPTKTSSSETGKKYVTVKVAGRDVQVDPQTGQIKPLTADEARQLAEGLKTMLNRSTEGLAQVQNADGSVSMDLQGRFKNVAVARVNDDGAVEQSCVDAPLPAAQFFGIDPQLLGVQRVANASAQPVVRTPAKRVAQ